MPASIEMLTVNATAASPGIPAQQQELYDRHTDVAYALQNGRAFTGDVGTRDRFLENVNTLIQTNGNDYLAIIKELNESDQANGTKWLQSVVDQAAAAALSELPGLA